MAQSHLHQSVLPAKPQADCNAYLNGLLDELARRRDAIPVVPGCSVAISHTMVMELRGVISEVIGTVRNQIKWQTL
jgi:hypothetical protein